ncbi:hypothetical protein [Frigoribacterium endophyticum]|uniref:hypothetical protein n=1 Tax=Frigoribacterium endophyticum TaxID=1522176 RepID=UPI0014240264|nr:hypothetical protein [Frigoribacterium endophyticum]NII52163.1 hypothetical protein [Frigoribacterium endophyticum]
MTTIRTRRSIIASLTLVGAATAALITGAAAQAATEPDTTSVVFQDTGSHKTDPALRQDPATGSWFYDDVAGDAPTNVPAEGAGDSADPATDPTLHQDPATGPWYYADVAAADAAVGQM